MSKYLLIETKSPSGGGSYSFELGKQLRDQQHDVTVYLLQDAVFTARARLRAGESLLQDAQKAGLGILADGVSLRQRGIIEGRVAKSVRVSDMGELVDLLMERTDKAIWH
jgi:sulfur relay protein TusB/DsrH